MKPVLSAWLHFSLPDLPAAEGLPDPPQFPRECWVKGARELVSSYIPGKERPRERQRSDIQQLARVKGEKEKGSLSVLTTTLSLSCLDVLATTQVRRGTLE